MRCENGFKIGRDFEEKYLPCGKCLACLHNKREMWTVRILKESEVAKSGWFITLTYNDESVPWGLNQTLDKTDFQKFLKRLRKKQHAFEKTHKIEHYSIRYFGVGEYGENTHRPHYHAIIFNIRDPVLSDIQKIWGLGHVKVGEVNQKTIHYTTKYMINKLNHPDGTEKPFSLMSRKPGIGANYLTENKIKYHKNSQTFYINIDGFKKNIPRYYKEKIFNKDEIEKNNQRVQQSLIEDYVTQKQKCERSNQNINDYFDNIENHKKRRFKNKLKNNSNEQI